ncbi:hypothetical protein GGS21DRAFT_85522 [Xylaria nigripes]|nr:hypothetical protein GGS21DRAFT_85522 [Xylaria nigripes]
MSSSILRLPDSATRLISSHVVVVTPVSLVKELLENSIDAKANSIEILLSPDTISRIEIRDDGVGIHPDDYDALGRRGHTSKLRAFDELGNVVGKTLGFRGEALASVNSLADITITTKTSTEPVAATLHLIPGEGGVLKQRAASAPVGTTIRVTGLFGHQPVREQMAIKEAKKTLDKIQELLRSYAMARPQIKLVFKVLQSPTKIWSYSPKPNANVAEAALQVFGIEVSSNCFLRTVRSSHPSSDSSSSTPGLISTSTTQGFVLEAFLANPEAELQNVLKRHYVSVDGRPINAGRGIAKKLLNIYLEHLKTSTVKKDVTDSFIRLNICCPSGSYDANIEPSKDNVLFTDESAILDTFRHLCDEIYKPSTLEDGCQIGTINSQQNGTPAVKSPGQGHHHGTRTQSRSLDCRRTTSPNILNKLLEASCDNPIRSVEQSSNVDEPIHDRRSPEIQTSIKFTPINTNERRREGPRLLDSQEAIIQREQIMDGRLNPWVIAKMNGLSEPLPSKPDIILESPPRSPLRSEPPVLRHTMAPPGDLDVPRSQRNAKSARLSCDQRCIVPGGSYRNPVARPSDSQPKGGSDIPLARSHMTIRRQRRREQPPWTPPSSLETSHYTGDLSINPSRSPNGGCFKQTQISFGGAHASLEANNTVNIERMFTTARENLQYQLSQTKNSPLTEPARDGGRERQHQESMRQRKPFSVIQTRKVDNNEAPTEVHVPIATTLPTGDPRAYLLRRQKSIAAEESGARPKRLRRLKSCLMPLETIPIEYQTHSLSWAMGLDGRVLNELVHQIREYDEYIIYGTLVDGIDMSLDEGHEIESRVRKLLAEKGRNVEDENGEATINLEAVLKGKGVTNGHA